jgi:hypothetical protein
MPTVRAKFKVSGINRMMSSRAVNDPENPKAAVKYVPAELQTIHLTPVYGNNDPNHENTKFWNLSPSGKIELGCLNLDAASKFQLDEEIYVDFIIPDKSTEK